MDFELSPEQQDLRDAAMRLLDDQATSDVVRVVVERGGGFDPGLWTAMLDQGWTGVAVPESEGGLGLGVVELAVLLEQTGAHVAPTPFLQQAVGLAFLAGTEWADALLAGSSVATLTWSGRREAALYAPSADVAVGVQGDEVVVADLRDARPAAEPAMDRTRQVGWLDLAALPTTPVGGPDVVQAFLDLGALAHAAETLGASGAVLDMTVAYAKEREQFGRPIGSFQAVKHRCADMLVDVEGMRSAVYWAAWAIGAGDTDASVAASTAKCWTADAGRRVMASGLQVHGGIGFTWEHDLHLFLKRAHLDQVTFGDATFHRTRIAALLRPRVEAGEPVV